MKKRIIDHEESIQNLGFCCDNSKIISASKYGKLKLWDFSKNKIFGKTLERNLGKIQGFSVSNSG